MELLKRGYGYNWSNMLQLVKDEYSFCRTCEFNKIERKGYHPLNSIRSDFPLNHVIIDLVQLPACRGYSYLLHIHDVASSFAILRPMRLKAASIVARKLFKVFSLTGFPNILSSDNGSEFKNTILTAFKALASMVHNFGVPYKPQTQGANERKHLEIKKILKSLLQGHYDWVSYIPVTQIKINQIVTRRTNTAPFNVFQGRANNLLCSLDNLYPALSLRVTKYNEQMNRNFEKNNKIIKFNIGDYVKLKNRGTHINSLTDLYIGAYQIAQCKNNCYVLKELNGDPAVGISNRLIPPHELQLIRSYNAEQNRDSLKFKKILDHGYDFQDQQIYK
eukprot:Pgem_evm1s4774